MRLLGASLFKFVLPGLVLSECELLQVPVLLWQNHASIYCLWFMGYVCCLAVRIRSGNSRNARALSPVLSVSQLDGQAAVVKTDK